MLSLYWGPLVLGNCHMGVPINLAIPHTGGLAKGDDHTWNRILESSVSG